MEVSVPRDSSSRIIRFSTFEVNLHTGELRQRGQKVKLQEQPLQALAALLERSGEMFIREDCATNSGRSATRAATATAATTIFQA